MARMYLSTVEAADLLGMTPAMLRRHVERFEFPAPVRGLGPRIRFAASEAYALREAFDTSWSPAGAVETARYACAARAVA